MTIDPSAQGVLDLFEALEIPAFETMSPEECRNVFEELRDPDAPVAEVAKVEDREIAGVPVRIYIPEGTGPRPVLQWMHGGGWVIGSVERADPTVRSDGSTEPASPIIPSAVPLTPSRQVSNTIPPGTLVSAKNLRDMGFIPLDIEILDTVSLPFGESGVNWNTIGDVPDSPGVYAFTVADDEELRVTYVGLTSHLWMVTKGRLPDGSARGGQRYGRPKHAGATRTRVNTLVAKQVPLGRTVLHWVKPVSDVTNLPELEESFIRKWDLRLSGWNRG